MEKKGDGLLGCLLVSNCSLFKVLYQTTMPYDPEGILGTINTIFMAFLGLQVPLFFLAVSCKDLKESRKWGGNVVYLWLRPALTKPFLEQRSQANLAGGESYTVLT